MIKQENLDEYFRGEKLYGDDFSPDEIEQWFKDEEDGYFDLGAGDQDRYEYGYHAINYEHGFSHLPEGHYDSVLGIGSAYGDELKPIATNYRRIVILEPSEGFKVKELSGIPVTYEKPLSSGQLPFPTNQFDLITCFGVLHHIPNVSTVIKEIYRCLNRGGYALIREPTASMGDWRKPRRGLTKHERGIPSRIFHRAIVSSGFRVISERRCMFSLTSRLSPLIRGPV